jgi:hypothetical protein
MAARQLGMSVSALQHRARQAPYQSLRIDNGTRTLRWSRRRIEAFLAHPPASVPVEGSPALDDQTHILPVPPPRRRGLRPE